MSLTYAVHIVHDAMCRMDDDDDGGGGGGRMYGICLEKIQRMLCRSVKVRRQRRILRVERQAALRITCV